jgi:alkanesulfonate monooxygenase SsuD/methylene tetrahydromethanopterin reductase-like flavin-dependent oxidoreductase (luciferase family)
MSERPKRVTEAVRTLKAAFSGDPFEFRGRTVQLTPSPFRPGGPSITLGGSSEAAARRAARIGDGFIPTTPEVWEPYRDEVQRLGRPDPGPSPIGTTSVVAFAEDAEEGWEQMAPFFLHEMNAYGAWQAQDDLASPYRTVKDVDELRATGSYRVLTPGEFIAEQALTPVPHVGLHPMCGGIPPELAWSSLRLFEREVLPAL